MLRCCLRKLNFHHIRMMPLTTEQISYLGWFLLRARIHTKVSRVLGLSQQIGRTLQNSSPYTTGDPKVDFRRIQQRIKKLGIAIDMAQVEKNWSLLQSSGCSDDHINCYPKILSVPTSELIKHISRLHEIGYSQISVGALRISRKYSRDNKACEKKLNEFLEDDLSLTSCDILRCSQSDIETIVDSHPSALDSLTSNPRKLKDNVDLMYEYGYTVDYFFKYPQVVNYDHNTLRQKLDLVREIQNVQMTTRVGYLLKSVESLEKILEKANHKSKQQGLSDSDRINEVAKLFKIDDTEIVLTWEFKYYCNMNMITKNKVDSLENAGYNLRELQCKPVIFKYTKLTIEQALEFIRTTRPESMGEIQYLIDVLEGKINKRHKDVPESLSKHIADVLDIPFASFSMTQKKLFGKVSLSKVNENLLFLKEKGFSLNDIRSCPLILVQDKDLINKCYDQMQTREDLWNFREDNVKCLNAIQYLIEYQSADYED